MAASRAICSVWWPMKLGLALSVACLGSRFRGLCYQLWNLRAAKLRVPVCVCVCALFSCVWFGLSELSRDKCLSDPGWNFGLCFFTLIAGCGRPSQSPPFWGFFKSVFLPQTLGFQSWSFVSKASAGPVAFLKKSQRIYHTHCVYDCAMYHAPSSCSQGTEMGRRGKRG